MAKMFSSGFKPKSTTKEAKKIIRDEMKAYARPKERGTRSALDAIKKDADAYDGGFASRYPKSDYTKGAGLVDGGWFACYYSDQMKMLGKIYGKENVEKWDGNKIHNTYKHLIGREYAAMLVEREKAKLKKKEEKAKKKKTAKNKAVKKRPSVKATTVKKAVPKKTPHWI